MIDPRSSFRWRSILWIVALGFGLSACESSNDEDEFVPPPIVVSFSSPGPLAPSDADLESISLTLNRAAQAGQMVSTIFPFPPVLGEFRATSGTQRTWNWVGIELDQADGGYHVLIDGLEMAEPYVLSFGVDPTRISDVGIGGMLATQSYQFADPATAVVFALRLDTLFNPNDPETWIEAWANGDILAATSIEDENFSVDEPLRYRLNFLEDGRRYYLVTIADTSGDLNYDPRDDWWDVSRLDGAFSGFQARNFAGDKDDPAFDVDMRLRPPAVVTVDESINRR